MRFIEESSSHDTVKELILKAHEWLKKIGNCRKENNQTQVEFARTIEQLFDRWGFSNKIGSSCANLRQLILAEEFKKVQKFRC